MTPMPSATPTARAATATTVPTSAVSTPTRTPTRVPSTATSMPTRTATPIPAPPPATGPVIVTFDDLPGRNVPLTGEYPSRLINWGTNTWYLSAPWGRMSTKSISLTSGRTSGSFSFVTPQRLSSLQAYNGGSSPSMITLACTGQPTKQVTLKPNQLATIDLGWTGTCNNVMLTSSNGWWTNIDNLMVYRS
jgi:hypothetical protein